MKELFILAMFVFMTGCASGKMEKKTSFATVNSNNTDRGIAITYINTQYLTENGKDTIKNPSVGKNSVVAELMFNQKVEIVRRRDGVDEKDWRRDVYLSALKDNPLVFETCKTYWAAEYAKSSEDNIYIAALKLSKNSKDFRMVTDSIRIGISYTDKAKELPLDDTCSRKAAELYLADIAKAAAVRTEEYINK